MRTLGWAVVALLAATVWCEAGLAAPKVHVVALGGVRRVPFTPADTMRENKGEESSTLKVRALMVDDKLKEWTMGEVHEVTERSFAVRRVLHVNDTLPGDSVPRWVWQPGPWLLVDRTTGHVAALHLPDFDAAVSEAVWFRDYAAYCGTGTTAKGGLFAVVAQIGVRRAAVQKQIGAWPQADHFLPVCKAAVWQRLPMRVTIQPTGGEATTYEVVGSTALVEEGDAGDGP